MNFRSDFGRLREKHSGRPLFNVEKGVFLCSSSNHEKLSLESPDHSELISEVLLFSFLRVGLATQLRWILNLGLQVCTTIHAHQEPMSK